MHLASPTGPAQAGVSSDIMKKSSSATCYVRAWIPLLSMT
jgi:hypothetical protein